MDGKMTFENEVPAVLDSALSFLRYATFSRFSSRSMKLWPFREYVA